MVRQRKQRIRGSTGILLSSSLILSKTAYYKVHFSEALKGGESIRVDTDKITLVLEKIGRRHKKSADFQSTSRVRW